MKKFVPGIGQSDFRLLRESGYDFVDKTFFIRDVLEDSSLVVLFPRPRRFGKTTNLSMLGHFLRKSDENLAHLFSEFVIATDTKAMAHFQKYPVITITFKDVKGKTYADMMLGIRRQIVMACREHRYLLDGDKIDPDTAEDLRQVISRKPSDDDLRYAFRLFSEALHTYHKQRVVILIDEYDSPLHVAYENGYFDDAVSFFRSFLSACLKDNSSLFKGVITGILRVSRESMFSELNHISVYSMIDKPYNTAFGFTENEVRTIVAPEKLDEVRAWYNGYIFGGEVIYNPWSILNYSREELLKPYWVNTGSTNLIEKLALKQGMGLSDKSTVLLNGGTIDQRVDTNIVLRDIELDREAFWNFLLFAGYLKPIDLQLVVGRYYAKLAIPNEEVRIVYQDLFKRWLDLIDPYSSSTEDLVKALLSGDAATVQVNLGDILLRAMSFFDAGSSQPEKLYHGFVLGLLIHLEKQYEVRSNPEAGHGRADVTMRPKTPGRPGVVIEFKVKRENQSADVALEDAAKQVREKRYAVALTAVGISPVYEYAMAFDGKQAYVELVDDVLAKAKTSAAKAATKTAAKNRKPARKKR
jgi:hypothetical protein